MTINYYMKKFENITALTATVLPGAIISARLHAKRCRASPKVILARTKTGATGRQYAAMLAPKTPANQRRAVKVFTTHRLEARFFHVLL